MADDRVRIVLDNSENERHLIALTRKHHWSQKRRIGKKGQQPAESIWTTDDEATDLHWIEDHNVGALYILVRGPEVESVAAALRDELSYFSSEDIIERARDRTAGPEDRRTALYQLAIDKMDHGFDQETFVLYAEAMRDPDPFVRGSAVTGSAYLGWTQLIEPLRPLAGPDEPDPGIRKDAALLVGRLEKLTDSAPAS